MNENTTPPIPLAIVEWLERLFPLHYFSIEATHAEMMYHQGTAAVAQKVRATYTSQNKTE